MSGRLLRYGMVGGGPGAFIGDVHRMAAELDGHARIAAGAFSSKPERSAQKGAELGLDPDRAYGSYAELVEAEAERDDGIDFVVIVTPNNVHFDPARLALEAGLHVVCDKPLTTSLDDAERLCQMVADGDRVFGLTHNYTGYPMVKEARHLVQSGRLGDVRRIQIEYLQGWLSTPLEQTGQRQADWRTDPARAGVSGALGDIGTHGHNLARYVTGLELEELCGDLTTFVGGRGLEDDASLLMRWTGGARGSLSVSQIAKGEENGLSLRIYGSEGSLTWRQEEPETLWFAGSGGPVQKLRRGHDCQSAEAVAATRLPPGHPEGFIEAFANLYRGVASAIDRIEDTGSLSWEAPPGLDYPTVWDGARGVHFLDCAVEAGRSGGWVDARYTPPGEPPR